MKKGLAVLSLCVASGLVAPSLAVADDEVCKIFVDAGQKAMTLRQKGVPLDQTTIDTITKDYAMKYIKPNSPEKVVAKFQALYLSTAMLAYEEPIVPKSQRAQVIKKFVSKVKNACK